MKIFVSHVTADREVANLVKDFLVDHFPSSEIFVSGQDLVGGELWVKELQTRLKEADLIISLITGLSVKSNWVNFESGVGFITGQTIPLIVESLSLEEASGVPMNHIQSRKLSEEGIDLMMKDICGKVGLPEVPARSSDDLISAVKKVIMERAKCPQLLAKIRALRTEASKAIQHDLKQHYPHLLPQNADLSNLSYERLVELSNSMRNLLPIELSLNLLGIVDRLPKANASDMEKQVLNHDIETIENSLEIYETNLGLDQVV